MDYDIFNDIENELKLTDNNIHITVISQGRKKNTYIKGLDLPQKELLEHLQNFKKSFCCNGSLKNNIIHLQGDHKQKVDEYFIKKSI